MDFSLSFLIESWPVLGAGLARTLAVSAGSIALAFLLGAVCAWIRHERVPVLTWIVYGYVELFRSTPILAQAYLIYFGLPSLGIRFNSDVAACIALTLWGGAYNTENIRAGMIAVPPGLSEASSALGFDRLKTMRLIILPLAFRISIPSVTNISISIFKSSSLMIGIGFHELTYAATNLIYQTFRISEMLISLAVIYLSISTLISYAARRLAQRVHVAGV
ncbi:amino acid ABC transporter permease [Shinella pollutisoli]|uniref:Amino acid ABC transporter permease n=1 Tax=Shinella pollutisoli TaxID=2250594 RepID=A0ABV7DM17_9HYPH|nr:amino acid ABC transporter permease [Shinella pollutisoli]